jgi:pimeloyl-ACP methyl ester carboxylesterase
MWQRTAPLLAERFSIIVVDLPGFGESDAPRPAFTTDQYAVFLRDFEDTLGFHPTTIAGISYGGQIALSFACQFPQHVQQLVLIASTGMFVPQLFGDNGAIRAVWRGVARAILRNEWLMCRAGASSFHDVSTRPPTLCRDVFEQISRPGHSEAWIAGMEHSFGERETVVKRLPSIRARTLLIWGENDVTVPLRTGREFHAAIAGSRLISYPGCAHSVPLEEPEKLAEDIVRFVEAGT